VDNILRLTSFETREYVRARPGDNLFFDMIMNKAIRMSYDMDCPCWIVNNHGLVLTTVDATPMIPA
jgi:hypothetical protein